MKLNLTNDKLSDQTYRCGVNLYQKKKLKILIYIGYNLVNNQWLYM